MPENQSDSNNTYESILKQTAQKKRSVFSLSKTFPAYIVLLVLLIISYFIWNFFTRQVEDENQEKFDKATSSVITRFEQAYQSAYAVLQSQRSIADLLPGQDVHKSYFTLYGTVSTSSYSQLLSLMYINKVDSNDIEDYEYRVQSTGIYFFKVHPIHGQEVLYPIQFMVPEIIPTPENSFEVITGYDLGTDDMVSQNIFKARDSNMVVATSIFDVRPDTSGFYLLSPLFPNDAVLDDVIDRRNLFEGLIALEVDSDEFFKNALGDGVPTDSLIVFQLFEVQKNNNQILVFESENAYILETDYQPYKMEELYLSIADKVITVRFSTIPNFGGSFQRSLPTLSLVISLLLSFLLFGFLLSVTTSRARAMDIADRMTRSQRRIVDSSQDIIAVMGMDGVWKSMNPASIGIFGIQPDQFTGIKIDRLFTNAIDKKIFYDIFVNNKEEYTERLDFQMKTEGGEFKWISWSFTVSKIDQLVYAIGRDVTLEKLAEQRELVRRKQIQLSNQHSFEESQSKSFFMTKMSHNLRNSLTGIIGYLQLISNKAYDSEEEMLTYTKMSEEAAEEMLSFATSDVLEVALGQGVGYNKLEEINFKEYFDMALKEAKLKLNQPISINIEFMGDSNKANVVVDKKILLETLTPLLKSFLVGTDSINLDINAEENPNEGATEIQILTSNNELVSNLINTYNENKTNLIEYLDKDTEDILLNFGMATSNCRIIHGNIKIETLGKDGNLVQLTLPLTSSENFV